jgi:hypothetical protein
VRDAEEFFSRLDRDMDGGWQMSRQWVEHPGREARCQIVADRLLAALENGNQPSAQLMAAYIMARLPGVREVHVDTEGDMTATSFVLGAA